MASSLSEGPTPSVAGPREHPGQHPPPPPLSAAAEQVPTFITELRSMHVEPLRGCATSAIALLGFLGGVPMGPEAGLGAAAGAAGALLGRLPGLRPAVGPAAASRTRLYVFSAMCSALASILPTPLTTLLLVLELGRPAATRAPLGEVPLMRTLTILGAGATASFVVYYFCQGGVYLSPFNTLLSVVPYAKYSQVRGRGGAGLSRLPVCGGWPSSRGEELAHSTRALRGRRPLPGQQPALHVQLSVRACCPPRVTAVHRTGHVLRGDRRRLWPVLRPHRRRGEAAWPGAAHSNPRAPRTHCTPLPAGRIPCPLPPAPPGRSRRWWRRCGARWTPAWAAAHAWWSWPPPAAWPPGCWAGLCRWC